MRDNIKNGSQHDEGTTRSGVVPSPFTGSFTPPRQKGGRSRYGRRNSPSTSTAAMKVSHSARVKRTRPASGELELRTSTTPSMNRASTHCPLLPLRVGLCHCSFSAAICALLRVGPYSVRRIFDHFDRLQRAERGSSQILEHVGVPLDIIGGRINVAGHGLGVHDAWCILELENRERSGHAGICPSGEGQD